MCNPTQFGGGFLISNKAIIVNQTTKPSFVIKRRGIDDNNSGRNIFTENWIWRLFARGDELKKNVDWYLFWKVHQNTVWKLSNFALTTLITKKFVKSTSSNQWNMSWNDFTKYFQVRVNFSFFHTVLHFRRWYHCHCTFPQANTFST